MALNNIAQLLAHTIDKSGENQKFNAEQLMKINALRSAEYGMNKRAKVTSDRNTALAGIAMDKLMAAREALVLKGQQAKDLATYKDYLMRTNPKTAAQIDRMNMMNAATQQGMDLKENIIEPGDYYSEESPDEPLPVADVIQNYGKKKMVRQNRKTGNSTDMLMKQLAMFQQKR